MTRREIMPNGGVWALIGQRERRAVEPGGALDKAGAAKAGCKDGVFGSLDIFDRTVSWWSRKERGHS